MLHKQQEAMEIKEERESDRARMIMIMGRGKYLIGRTLHKIKSQWYF